MRVIPFLYLDTFSVTVLIKAFSSSPRLTRK